MIHNRVCAAVWMVNSAWNCVLDEQRWRGRKNCLEKRKLMIELSRMRKIEKNLVIIKSEITFFSIS